MFVQYQCFNQSHVTLPVLHDKETKHSWGSIVLILGENKSLENES